MNNFIPKKCKTCEYLGLDDEENIYTCDKAQEYLTKDLSNHCVLIKTNTNND